MIIKDEPFSPGLCSRTLALRERKTRTCGESDHESVSCARAWGAELRARAARSTLRACDCAERNGSGRGESTAQRTQARASGRARARPGAQKAARGAEPGSNAAAPRARPTGGPAVSTAESWLPRGAALRTAPFCEQALNGERAARNLGTQAGCRSAGSSSSFVRSQLSLALEGFDSQAQARLRLAAS